jgi:Transmembrane secretion effector
MPDSLNNPKDKFFTYWEQYKKAKYADQKRSVFEYAIHCRGELQKIANFTGSPFLLSVMSTLASLPFFLFTLPAGALADKVDRQKLVCFINVGWRRWLWS